MKSPTLPVFDLMLSKWKVIFLTSVLKNNIIYKLSQIIRVQLFDAPDIDTEHYNSLEDMVYPLSSPIHSKGKDCPNARL